MYTRNRNLQNIRGDIGKPKLFYYSRCVYAYA